MCLVTESKCDSCSAAETKAYRRKVKKAPEVTAIGVLNVKILSVNKRLYCRGGTGIVVLDRFHDQLCVSDLQFWFRSKRSSDQCTMVLKETIAYYTHNGSPVYSVFLDATKAFDRVNYCKLFDEWASVGIIYPPGGGKINEVFSHYSLLIRYSVFTIGKRVFNCN